MFNDESLGKLIIQHTKSPKIELLVHRLHALFVEDQCVAYILSEADSVDTYFEAIEVANTVFSDLGHTEFILGLVSNITFSHGNIDMRYLVIRFAPDGKIIDPHRTLCHVYPSLYTVEKAPDCSGNS